MKRRTPKGPYPTILAWRDALDLSQKDAAKVLGISQSHLCNIEKGVRLAGRRLAKRISATANVPLETLLEFQRTA